MLLETLVSGYGSEDEQAELDQLLRQNAELVEMLKRARQVVGYFEAAFTPTLDSEQLYWDIDRWLKSNHQAEKEKL